MRGVDTDGQSEKEYISFVKKDVNGIYNEIDHEVAKQENREEVPTKSREIRNIPHDTHKGVVA